MSNRYYNRSKTFTGFQNIANKSLNNVSVTKPPRSHEVEAYGYGLTLLIYVLDNILRTLSNENGDADDDGKEQ